MTCRPAETSLLPAQSREDPLHMAPTHPQGLRPWGDWPDALTRLRTSQQHLGSAGPAHLPPSEEKGCYQVNREFPPLKGKNTKILTK